MRLRGRYQNTVKITPASRQLTRKNVSHLLGPSKVQTIVRWTFEKSNETCGTWGSLSSLPNNRKVGFSSSTDEALMAETGILQKPTSHLAPLKRVLLFLSGVWTKIKNLNLFLNMSQSIHWYANHNITIKLMLGQRMSSPVSLAGM